MRLPFALLLTVSMLVGCTSTGASGTPSETVVRPSASEIGSTEPSGGVLPADVAAEITADAAAVLGVDVANVTIVSAEPTTWNDGSLGCPKPGVMYTQVVTEGFTVIVASGDQRLDYRTGRGGEFKRCEGFKPGG